MKRSSVRPSLLLGKPEADAAFLREANTMFRYSYSVGSLGAYDRGAIWNAHCENEDRTRLPPGQAGDGEPE